MIPDANFTLAKAKAHLRVVHALEDALITAFLDAAVAACERFTRRAWTARTWSVLVDACDLTDCGCDDPAVFHALLSPASAKAFKPDGLGGETELPAADVTVSTRYGHSIVSVANWTAGDIPGNAGRLEYTAPEPTVLPPDVYAAAMLYLGDLYVNREAQLAGLAIAPNPMAEMLLRPYVVEMHA
jgi:hypothetical protein